MKICIYSYRWKTLLHTAFVLKPRIYSPGAILFKNLLIKISSSF